MKIIEPSVEILSSIDIYKLIEQAGRVCYKSEDKIAEGTAEKFISGIIKRGHEAVLEHGTIIVQVDDYSFDWTYARTYDCLRQPSYMEFTNFTGRNIISGNVRAWRELFKGVYKKYIDTPALFKAIAEKYPILFPEYQDAFTSFPITYCKFLQFADLVRDERDFHYRISVKFTCDRGISHEIVRHRPASYCQESTRYCNYSGDKFGNEITVIKPYYWTEDSENYATWKASCSASEGAYFALLAAKASPQEARAVLPNSLKTELVMTANVMEWNHFLTLRCAGAAHPQMQQVANMVKEQFKTRFPTMFDLND